MAKRALLRSVVLLSLAWLVPGCGNEHPAQLTVFAAASLQGSLDEVGAAWTRHSGQPVTLVYGGSAMLAQQIDRAAPAQVFISADRQWMDWLQQRGRIDPASRTDILGNTLVLVAPGGTTTPAPAASPADVLPAALGSRGQLALADVDTVPAGRYAREALQSLRRWDAVQGRLVQAADVRAALAFVAQGQAALGIVYATDAAAEPRVRVVAAFPKGSHASIVYPAARVADAEAGQADPFLAFLRGDEARAIFRRAGFRDPPGAG